MGFGPAPASQKLMARLGLVQTDFDVTELNEAFAAQGLARLRALAIADDDCRVNPNGGAIALGHPLGMSGARMTGTAALQLALADGRRSLSTMCVGVGQGIAIALERLWTPAALPMPAGSRATSDRLPDAGRTSVTDMGKQVSGRRSGRRKRAASGRHAVVVLCGGPGFNPRPAPPQHPQTNRRIDRVSGPIGAALAPVPVRR